MTSADTSSDNGAIALHASAGAYLRELRRAHHLSQGQLGELVEVGRGTVERLERGDVRVNVSTLFQILDRLGGSPQIYYTLATQPDSRLGGLRQQRGVLRGVVSYIQVLAERKRVPATTLDEIAHAPIARLRAYQAEQLSPYALLLTLLFLDAPLADLDPIVRATSDHERLGRQLAEARSAFFGELERHEPAPQHAIPSLDVVVSRITTMLQPNRDMPAMLRHELARIEADLKRFRALLSLAVGHITADP